jgi:small GTP-binding protein
MLPDSDDLHFAEVLLGGLIQATLTASDDPDNLAFEFHPGVRETLLDRQDITRSLEVVHTVTRWISEHFGQSLDFQAILDNPDGFVPIPITEANKPFASIAMMLLNRLGGRYAKAADRLGSGIPRTLPSPTDQKTVTEVDSPRDGLIPVANQPGRPIAEAKLLLVGQGGVGKTSLVRYLVENKPCKKGERATEGIRRAKWPRPIKPPGKRDSQTVTLNVWDFGGQEIMHATHQFFLTKRSLYLLVLDARTTEAENNLFYWLKVIQSFGGEVPILVVLNKAEGRVALELNESRLKKDFAPNLRGFLRVSCETGKGIPALRKAIDDQIRQLGHVFDILPGSYFKVKEQLAGLAGKKSYISYTDYESLCTESQVADESSRNQLLRLLHDLGAALNFSDPDDPYELHNTIVFDPEWVTDAVYRIITNPLLGETRGVLKRDQLAGLLKNKKKFPPIQHDLIIDLMRKFELCFDFPDASGDRYLVPERLAKVEPDVGWDEGDPLRFQVKYNVLPPGLVCRFIVKMYTYLKPDTPTYWRDGAVLYIHENRCLLRGSVENRRIYIAIQGAEETRREALSLIRDKLEEIHRTIKGLVPIELVPVPGQPGVEVEHSTLIEMLRENIDRLIPQGGKRSVSARELVRLVDSEQRWLSYGLPLPLPWSTTIPAVPVAGSPVPLVAAEVAEEFEYVIEGETRRGTRRVLGLDIGGGQTMKFVRIGKGIFLMGAPDGEEGAISNEKPQRQVTISKDFYLGMYAVTQAEYKVVTGQSPSRFQGDQLPVENMSWEVAVAFCQRLTDVVKRRVDLPTEAQWEYACRGGQRPRFTSGRS